ncbi:ABC transporter ATP-binding protein [Nocardioides sp. NPDC059952]|uniref:ABC transporter ATP-binding protein n=1 Tax=Nocardioides sp. NPDC059952 TaxID=3347014 RepID=UPI00364F483F
MSAPLLRITDLSVSYALPRRGTGLGTGAALREVSLDVRAGEILGIVGETGSGKTTLARATVGLVTPATGTITFDGVDIGGLKGSALRGFRRSGQIQLVFQDPLRSLDPDLTVDQLVSEPLAIAGVPRSEQRVRVEEAIGLVGLDPSTVHDRLPRQLSGGQRQRIALARAIVTRPQLLFCDEPVSALDVSNRNLVLSLLDRLRRELGLAVVIIAHDLSSLAGVADRIAVFYRSRLVESGPVEEVLTRPAHPYTALLTASAPSVAHEARFRPADLRLEQGAEPPRAGPDSCVFLARCRFAHDACHQQPLTTPLPGPTERTAERTVACHAATTWPSQIPTTSTPTVADQPAAAG